MAIYASLIENTIENKDRNPFQFGIDLERANLAMFESLIQLDMVEVCNEKGLISLTEEEQEAAKEVAKNGIISKIKELFKKFIDNITLFIDKFIMKVNEFFKADSGLLRNIPDYNRKNIKLCTLTGIKYIDSEKHAKMDNSAETIELLNRYLKNIYDATTVEEIENIEKKISKTEIPDVDIVSVVEGPIKEASNKVIEDIWNTADIFTKYNSHTVSEWNANKKKFREIYKNYYEVDTKYQIDSALLSKKYTLYGKVMTLVNKLVSAQMRMQITAYKVSRACILKVGKWIKNNVTTDQKMKNVDDGLFGTVRAKADKPKPDTQTEAYYYALEEISNMYVDEALSLV